MSPLWQEFFIVAGLHALAVASPGPDFAVVVRQSVNHGQRVGRITALGVGTGILLHVAYCLLGIAVLIRSSELVFNIMKYIAAGYLGWLGYKALRARPIDPQTFTDIQAKTSAQHAFRIGFLTNGLNPKATLFFLSLFTLVIKPSTPFWAQTIYGVYMALATAIWFTLVATFFGHPNIRQQFLKLGHWFDRIMGVALIALAIQIGLTGLLR